MKRRLTGLVQRGLRHAASDRSHPIEQIVLRSAGLARQPTNAQIDEMTAAVVGALSPLQAAAMSGNVHAIRKVTELAANLCAETTALACLHQEAANVVARERTAWPLNISPDAKERRRTLRLVTGPRRLPLGDAPDAAAKAAVAKKAGGFSNPASAALLVALKAIEIERSFRIPSELFPTLQPAWSAAAASLPELQPATADAWFKVIWLYVCERHGGAPENSELRRLAETAESPAASRANASAEPNRRAALRHALEQAFLHLVQGRRQRKRRGA